MSACVLSNFTFWAPTKGKICDKHMRVPHMLPNIQNRRTYAESMYSKYVSKYLEYIDSNMFLPILNIR
jgi:hypothetical protein